MARVFVALPLASENRNKALQWEKEHRSLPVRWLAEKNLHVTVIPPWEEDDVSGALEMLKSIEGKNGAFSAVFDRIRFGPNSREPRLIWAEGETPDQLFSLKHDTERALMRTPEARPFHLHVALARFRPEEFAKFPAQKLDERVSWEERFTSFVLMESHLLPAGADYEVLGSFAL